MNNLQTTPNNRQPKPIDAFNRLIQSQGMQNYLASTLHDKRDSFIANVTALVGSSAQLQACDPAAVIMTAVKATALNLPLDPNLGFAYVIPYQSQQGLVPQFQLGYKGYVQLALRTGQFKTINARDVREGEIVGEDYLSGEMRFQRIDNREAQPVIGYVAFFELLNGFRKSLYMSKTDVEAHALRFSKSYKNKFGVWQTNFDAMAVKTVAKLLLSKYAPMSIEMGDALLADGASYNGGQAQPIYVDNSTGEVIEPKEPTNYAEEIMMASNLATKDETEEATYGAETEKPEEATLGI